MMYKEQEMRKKFRLIFDVIVCFISVLGAIFFVVQWVNHGFPVYGNDDMLGGLRGSVVPFLWPAIVMLVLAGASGLDFYVHKD